MHILYFLLQCCFIVLGELRDKISNVCVWVSVLVLRVVYMIKAVINFIKPFIYSQLKLSKVSGCAVSVFYVCVCLVAVH